MVGNLKCILIDSGFSSRSMLERFSRRCTDHGLTINVKCRTKPKNLSRNNRLLTSVNSTNINRCCLVIYHIASDDDEETEGGCVQTAHKRNRRLSKDPVTRRIPSCTTLELRVCLGDEAHFLCEVSSNISRALISWKTPSGDVIVRGPSLVVPSVRRQDGGVYFCEVTDILGSTRLRKKLRLIVQFPPVITVPNQYSSNNPSSLDRHVIGHLSCTAEAVPSASFMWYKDSVLLVNDNATYQSHSTTSERTHCVTSSSLFFRRTDDREHFLNFSTDQSEIFYGNYTCTATNDYGYASRLFSLYGFSNVDEEEEEEEEIRKFNVTGFIIGMLPPIFISVYIILKLGYRSRYAEERPEDDGMREEPFFISY